MEGVVDASRQAGGRDGNPELAVALENRGAADRERLGRVAEEDFERRDARAERFGLEQLAAFANRLKAETESGAKAEA